MTEAMERIQKMVPGVKPMMLHEEVYELIANKLEEQNEALRLVVEALENIRLEGERFAKDAVMDWDAVQTIAYETLAEIRRSKK